jgi:hypothetical protein
MGYVRATNLSTSEAENVLAKIWIALEKHGLSSPKMTVFSRATKLEIEFLFESERDESLVMAELPGIMSRKIKALAIGGKIKGRDIQLSDAGASAEVAIFFAGKGLAKVIP